MLNIQRMRDGTCRSHNARARTPNPKKRKRENYKTDRLRGDEQRKGDQVNSVNAAADREVA